MNKGGCVAHKQKLLGSGLAHDSLQLPPEHEPPGTEVISFTRADNKLVSPQACRLRPISN